MNSIELSEREIREMLDREGARINSPEFIDNDPVQFPRQYDVQQDIELAALLSATIAWGNRKMICANCAKMLGLMEGRPYHFVMDGAYEELPDGNIHRTFFVDNLRHYLRAFRLIFARYGSLEGLARHLHIAQSESPAWELVEGMNAIIREANDGQADSRCLPQNLGTTALKRVNMALRWLVRDDGIVDMGVWSTLRPSQLFIPLDVHVGNTSRDLGLLTRRQDDRRAVEELTATLRRFRPADPTFYDYALFGLGIEGKKAEAASKVAASRQGHHHKGEKA